MTKPLTQHPEHIVSELPMHARAPRVEPGEPMNEARLAEDAYYRAMEREQAEIPRRKRSSWGPAITIAAITAVLIGLSRRR